MQWTLPGASACRCCYWCCQAAKLMYIGPLLWPCCYRTDPRAKRIVQSMHLWLVPTMNPDGFERRSRGNRCAAVPLYTALLPALLLHGVPRLRCWRWQPLPPAAAAAAAATEDAVVWPSDVACMPLPLPVLLSGPQPFSALLPACVCSLGSQTVDPFVWPPLCSLAAAKTWT